MTRGHFTASAGVARVLARSHLNVDAPVGLDGFAALLLVLFIWQGERREVRFLWAMKRGAKPEQNEAERGLLVARIGCVCLAIHEDLGKSEASDELCDK